MKGWTFLALINLFISVSGAESFKCYLPDSVNEHRINLKFTKKTERFVKPANYAAAAFPELKGKQIEIRRKKIGTLMAARPKGNFFFQKRENRKYIIYITDEPGMNAGLLFKDMSECAQAGVLGHELSHILEYNELNNFQMLWFGIKYFFKRKEIEERTDLTAMRRGFVDHLVEYTKYIHASPHTNKKYLRKKKKHYLSAIEMHAKFLLAF